VQLTPDWIGPVFDQLDRRLSHSAAHPVAVAVSGGGDSMALLRLAAYWASRRDRRLLVLSVDHGLNPQARLWNARVAETARVLGAHWRGLAWSAPKTGGGVQAAARRARHALLAGAAREAGARVVLVGHTADDIAEAEWMRAQGTPLGRLRPWSPSPVWPDGRGLMLLRPLLDVSRADLRRWLTGEGADWIEDPANTDPRFLRSRARAAAPALRPRPTAKPDAPFDLACEAETGVIAAPVHTPWLGPALACASGREAIAAPGALMRLKARLEAGHASSLSGAVARPGTAGLVISREPGRRPPTQQPLPAGDVLIWDGRFAVRASQAGWRIGPAAGLRAGLSASDRARLNDLPASARGVHPVLFRSSDARPVLADPAVEVSCLVAGRLRLACGQVESEEDL